MSKLNLGIASGSGEGSRINNIFRSGYFVVSMMVATFLFSHSALAGTAVDVLFIGDSITDLWDGEQINTTSYQSTTANVAMPALVPNGSFKNVGVAGATTQALLDFMSQNWYVSDASSLSDYEKTRSIFSDWFFEAGSTDPKYDPKVVVINVGLNNLLFSYHLTPCQTLGTDVVNNPGGVSDLVDRVREIYSNDTKILLVASKPGKGGWSCFDNYFGWLSFDQALAQMDILEGETLNVVFPSDSMASIYFNSSQNQFFDVPKPTETDLGNDLSEPNLTDPTVWNSTHHDNVHLTDEGYWVYAAAVKCRLNAMLDDVADSASLCRPLTAIKASDVNSICNKKNFGVRSQS